MVGVAVIRPARVYFQLHAIARECRRVQSSRELAIIAARWNYGWLLSGNKRSDREAVLCNARGHTSRIPWSMLIMH